MGNAMMLLTGFVARIQTIFEQSGSHLINDKYQNQHTNAATDQDDLCDLFDFIERLILKLLIENNSDHCRCHQHQQRPNDLKHGHFEGNHFSIHFREYGEAELQ
eukprot:SAG31_NODE_3029_length_4768_cov_4.130863_2_plen_104_part_00